MTEPNTTRTRAVRSPWTVALLVVAAVVFLQHAPGPDDPLPKDFAQYLVAGKVLLEREPDALYFTDAYTGITTKRFPESRFQQIAEGMGITDTSYFVYPPWVGLLYAPLTALSPYHALLAAYVLGWVFLVASLALLARRLPERRWSAAGITFLLLVHSFIFFHGVVSGQASLPLLVLFALFARAWWRGRDVEAGVWWAMATGIKLFPVLFLPYVLFVRRWRVLYAFAAAGLVLLVASLAAAGLEANLRFLETARGYLPYTTPRSTNFSLVAFLLRLTTPAAPDVWSVVTAPPALAWIHRVVVMGALVPVLVLGRRAERAVNPWAPLLAFGLAVSWVISASTNVWSHQVVAMAVPLTVMTGYLLARGGERPRGWLAAWTAGWAGLYFYQAANRAGDLGLSGAAHGLYISTSFLGLAVFFGLQIAMLRAATRRG